MKFLSATMTHASGKIGGAVASHNKGGLYLRAWRNPTNPRSSQQLAVRNLFSSTSAFWNSLTNTQRAAWNVMAENMTFPGVLGTAEKYSGAMCYQMCNLARLQAGLTRIDTAPVIYTMATLTPPVPTVTAAGTTVSVAFTNTDAWANEVGGGLLVSAGRALNAGKQFFVGPYRFAGKVSGAATPPTSPAVITLPFPTGPAGSKQGFKFVAVRADGRISTPFRVLGGP